MLLLNFIGKSHRNALSVTVSVSTVYQNNSLLISHTTAIKNNILEGKRYTVKNVSICVMYTYKINQFSADHTGYSESSEYPG